MTPDLFKRDHRMRGALVIIAVFALLAAACGDGDGDSASTPQTTARAGEAARGVTADTIRIGGLGQLSFFPGLEEGAKARFERANKEGGVAGRMIEYVGLKDDGDEGSANLDQAKTLVERDKVFAIVPATSAVMLPATTNYLAQERVPFLGWGFQPGFCTPDGWGYGINGCLIGTQVGVPDAVNNKALTDPIGKLLEKPDYTIAILNSDDDSGRGVSPQYHQLLGDRLLVEDFVPTEGVSDYSPYVNKVMSSGADAALVACDFSCTLAVKSALISGGFEGPVFDYATYIPGFLSDKAAASALEGTYINSQFPPQEEGGAAIEQAVKDLEAIGEAPLLTTGGAVGYWSADVFLQMLEAVGEDLTAERFHEVINAGFTYKPPTGGLGEVSFPKGFTQPTPCAALVKVENGKYVSALPFDCYGVVPATKD
jgi:ABC-type branched-subunit amino acid transport system substrate-binding protein